MVLIRKSTFSQKVTVNIYIKIPLHKQSVNAILCMHACQCSQHKKVHKIKSMNTKLPSRTIISPNILSYFKSPTQDFTGNGNAAQYIDLCLTLTLYLQGVISYSLSIFSVHCTLMGYLNIKVFKNVPRLDVNIAIFCQVLYWNHATLRKSVKNFLCIGFFLSEVNNIIFKLRYSAISIQ